MSNKLKKRLAFGCVSYINALPFSLELSKIDDIHLITAPPADLLSRLVQKEFAFALTSSVGIMSHSLNSIRGFGIAAHKEILSVNLHASSCFFSSPSLRIAVTRESRSSVILLNILCHYLWKTPQPEIIELTPEDILSPSGQEYDGCLLIGDSALHNPEIPGFVTYDLAKAWYDLTQLPFVFAMVLTNSSNSHDIIRDTLDTALSSFERSSEYVIRYAQDRSHLPEDLLRKYYKLCRYRLEDDDYAGFRKFQQYYADLHQ
ncbi:menaquinone biosynthesis family protein [Chlamydia ibidis]|uniref:Chorismate dehydratase n=2 Tax=Chlamydia ibidis TaxID=1405396 RepID=S7J5D0_9CHLA|nr:menaquinone biosynthesis protein [Chlamydia ibidis]EPP35433.1 menaquinone biosynthesis family protein [Chlamydia ibidis]EQM63226.1 hypothetical protein H359_0311 [Chlamydia ibidis 10-1398/6]